MPWGLPFPPEPLLENANKLEARKVPHVLRVYPQGDHGCSPGIGTSARGRMDEMPAFMK